MTSNGGGAQPAVAASGPHGGPWHALPLDEVDAARSDGEAFRRTQATRRAIEGRRPSRHGGGAAALLVVRNGDQIELLPHAADTWALTFDEARAVELRDALTELLALGEWA